MPSSKIEDYDVIETIGSGSYGTCRKIRRKCDGKVIRFVQSPSYTSRLVNFPLLVIMLFHEFLVVQSDFCRFI